MRIKICGITSVEDLELALRLGADEIGVVIAPSSPRCVDVDTAALLREATPRGTPFWLVARDLTPKLLVDQARRVQSRNLQLHEFDSSSRSWLKAAGMRLRVAHPPSLDTLRSPIPTNEERLIDVDGGGSGRCFDWGLLDAVPAGARLWIAGGITPENVSALAARELFGIDVSSGVESEAGRKCPLKLAALLQRCKTTPQRERRRA